PAPLGQRLSSLGGRLEAGPHGITRTSRKDRSCAAADGRSQCANTTCRTSIGRSLSLPDRIANRASECSVFNRLTAGLSATVLIVSRFPECFYLTGGLCPMNLSAHAMKYFMFDRSSCPPSCWRQASSPSSKPLVTGGIFAG